MILTPGLIGAFAHLPFYLWTYVVCNMHVLHFKLFYKYNFITSCEKIHLFSRKSHVLSFPHTSLMCSRLRRRQSRDVRAIPSQISSFWGRTPTVSEMEEIRDDEKVDTLTENSASVEIVEINSLSAASTELSSSLKGEIYLIFSDKNMLSPLQHEHAFMIMRGRLRSTQVTCMRSLPLSSRHSGTIWSMRCPSQRGKHGL